METEPFTIAGAPPGLNSQRSAHFAGIESNRTPVGHKPNRVLERLESEIRERRLDTKSRRKRRLEEVAVVSDSSETRHQRSLVVTEPPVVASANPSRTPQSSARTAIVEPSHAAVGHKRDRVRERLDREISEWRLDVRQAVRGLKHIELVKDAAGNAELDEVVSNQLVESLPRSPDTRRKK